MYIQRDKVYADAGKYLVKGNRVAYEFPGDGTDVQEVEDTLDGFTKVGSMVKWSNGYRAIKLIENGTYDDYKTKMVKARYSNDDQIAIMLNKDSGDEDDALAYQKMQEWREYASKVAENIINILTENK